VVLVRNEEVIHTSLDATEFLALYNGLQGSGGNEARGGALHSWVHAGPSGVWGMKTIESISAEAFKRIVGHPMEGMTDADVNKAMLKVRFCADGNLVSGTLT